MVYNLWVTGLGANLEAKVLITDELELVQVLGCESEIVELGFKSLLGVLWMYTKFEM